MRAEAPSDLNVGVQTGQINIHHACTITSTNCHLEQACTRCAESAAPGAQVLSEQGHITEGEPPDAEELTIDQR